MADAIYQDILKRDIEIYITGDDILKFEIEPTGEFLGGERVNIYVWFK